MLMIAKYVGAVGSRRNRRRHVAGSQLADALKTTYNEVSCRNILIFT